jgi:hypothetical protein
VNLLKEVSGRFEHHVLKPMPRFELGTSSLPRRHTARLCHIGSRFLVLPIYLSSFAMTLVPLCH